MVTTRPSPPRFDTVNPFLAACYPEPSEDTHSREESVQTVFPHDGGWKMISLTDLRDVEDLLDSLESCKVVEREVRILGDNNFFVRWR